MASVTLAWTKADHTPARMSRIEGYQIWRAAGGSAPGLLTTLPVVYPADFGKPVHPTGYVDTAVTVGVTYIYTVVAVDGAGRSLSSNEQSVVPVQIHVPTTARFAGTPDNFGVKPTIFNHVCTAYTLTGWLRQDNTGNVGLLNVSTYDASQVRHIFVGKLAGHTAFHLSVDSQESPGISQKVDLDQPTIGQWAFCAITVEDIGSSIRVAFKWAYMSDTAFVASRTAEITIALTVPVNINLVVFGGDTAYGSSGFSGGITQIRQWEAILTDAELLAEKDTTVAVKSGEWSDNPSFTGTDVSDQSGNGHLLFAFASHTTTTGPTNG